MAQLAGNELLGSFMWAVGEDALAGSRLQTPAVGALPDGAGADDETMDGSSSGICASSSCQQLGHASFPFPLAPDADGEVHHRDPAARCATAAVAASASTHAQPNPSALPSAHFLPIMPAPAFEPFGASLFGGALANARMPGCPNAAALFGAGLLPAGQVGGLGGLHPFSGLHPQLAALGMGRLPGLAPQRPGNESLAVHHQRLQRKAEGARMSRVKKKHYVATLELEVSELNAQLHALKNAAAAAGVPTGAPCEPPAGGAALADAQATDARTQAMDAKVLELSEILQRHSIDRLTSDVNSLVEQFVQNQRARQSSINDHFNEILDLVDAGPQVRRARPTSPGRPRPRGARLTCPRPPAHSPALARPRSRSPPLLAQYKMAFWDALHARQEPAAACDDASMDHGAAASQPAAQPREFAPSAAGASAAASAPGTGSKLLDLLVDDLQMSPAQIEKLEACRKVPHSRSAPQARRRPCPAPRTYPACAVAPVIRSPHAHAPSACLPRLCLARAVRVALRGDADVAHTLPAARRAGARDGARQHLRLAAGDGQHARRAHAAAGPRARRRRPRLRPRLRLRVSNTAECASPSAARPCHPRAAALRRCAGRALPGMGREAQALDGGLQLDH